MVLFAIPETNGILLGASVVETTIISPLPFREEHVQHWGFVVFFFFSLLFFQLRWVWSQAVKVGFKVAICA